MKFKLIDQNTNETIGDIKLDHLPRLKEYVEFKKETYLVVKITHTEKGVKLKVLEDSIGESEITTEWS